MKTIHWKNTNRKNKWQKQGRSLTIEHFEICLAVVIRLKLLRNFRLLNDFLLLFFLRRFCGLISHWRLAFSLRVFKTIFSNMTGSSLSFLSSLLCFLKTQVSVKPTRSRLSNLRAEASSPLLAAWRCEPFSATPGSSLWLSFVPLKDKLQQLRTYRIALDYTEFLVLFVPWAFLACSLACCLAWASFCCCSILCNFHRLWICFQQNNENSQ